jgi:hypothetical protein
MHAQIVVLKQPGEISRVHALVRSSLLLMALTLAAGLSPPAATEAVTVSGKVVTLADAVNARKLGVKLDPECTGKQVVLLGDDGSIVPLLADEASRALFVDERLRNRPSEIRGRRFAGVPYIQVLSFKVELEGRLAAPEYYCDVCAISVPYPRICDCCQGPTTLRARPDR